VGEPVSALWGVVLDEAPAPEFRPGNLATKFLQPPFTVLDTRKGDWQERRRSWLSLGIRSELGRGAHVYDTGASREGGLTQTMAAGLGRPEGTVRERLAMERQNQAGYRYAERGLLSKATERKGFGADYDTANGENAWGGSGTSIFDPVLCELAYRWWAPAEGRILDPFAGGSVRGIVAAKLGHPYTGVDLAAAQLEANRAQAEAILLAGEPVPHWIHGDSSEVLAGLPEDELFDMVFSCPPYYDLEVYSEDPADLSNMSWHDFLAGYERIIELAAQHLRPERFAVFVVSEVRDTDGYCRGLVPRTIHAFERVGLRLYNEAVLVNSAGSLPLRVTRYMEASRKLGRAHQNVLCFVKGKPPRGWSYDRAAPPSPQLALELEGEPVPVPATQCEDHPAGHHPTQAEADRCSAETYGEADWPAPELTPVEEYQLAAGGSVWVKRDDLFEVAGARGGKARTCWRLAQGAVGLVTAGSRASPQATIVAQVAHELGVPARLHMPAGEPTDEQALATALGAELVEHRPGHNSVIVARAREDAAERGWREIPFGMECEEAVEATSWQVAGLPPDARRVVVPVGSGMSLAGILYGLEQYGMSIPVLGVVVGADPDKRLDRWAPADWRERVALVPAGSDYHEARTEHEVVGLELDAHYEAKAAAFLRPGDLLWCVGLRATQAAYEPPPAPAPLDAPDEPDAATVAVPGPLLALDTPLPEVAGLVRTDDGRWVDPASGELYDRVPAPPREQWLAIRERTWSLEDPGRRCWTCGAPPTARARDGGPAYDHIHSMPMFSELAEEGDA
jgi:hypothetical protein